jgi:hypothetical protein
MHHRAFYDVYRTLENAAVHDIRSSLLFAESIHYADLGFSLNFVLNALVLPLHTAPQISCDGPAPVPTSAKPTPTVIALPGIHNYLLKKFTVLKLS